MAGRRITIQLSGDKVDDERLRFSEFIHQLETIRQALKHVDYLVSGTDKPSVYYQIVDLRHSSPATMQLEARPIKPDKDYSVPIVNRFFTGLYQIQRTGEAPADFNLSTLEAFKGMTKMLDKHISEVILSNGDYSIALTKEFNTSVDRIIGPDEIMEGSMDGMLELINIHNKANRFHIYPTVGPKKVVCRFPHRLLEKAVSAVGRYVNVIGKFKYKEIERYPYEISVSDIEIHPPEDDLPSLTDVRGIAPDATGDVSSEDFIRSIRDAEE